MDKMDKLIEACIFIARGTSRDGFALELEKRILKDMLLAEKEQRKIVKKRSHSYEAPIFERNLQLFS